ncbi:spore coat protein [Evansella cellulosilytica]|uniref:Coat F domain protein n=1 Tax=Evansella cellulosilytica (strain ATCC 21833 / DSM 2522 / FERM P-1141 / JCM 9156 / N-4) TaxID=649639 RepID=E6TQR9_EVAC2|nr:spore coat protein [Evansella cellulosilytica]ADU31694.1 Coat F domain protein [Evansella cellulosilytica DSM 2522]
MNNNQMQNQGNQQQSSKIQNPKTQHPETPQMTDRDFINDMLTTEKYMTDAYSVAMNEASHESLYTDIQENFIQSQQCQRKLFNLMFEKGWYSFDAEKQQTLQQSYQQFSGYQNQIPYAQNNTMS